MLATLGYWMLAQAGQRQSNPLVQLLPIIAILVIFYFLLIRPKQREQKAHQKMLGQLSKGDRVLTSGGLFGNVVGLKDDVVVLKIAENVKVEVLKSSVVRRLDREGS